MNYPLLKKCIFHVFDSRTAKLQEIKNAYYEYVRTTNQIIFGGERFSVGNILNNLWILPIIFIRLILSALKRKGYL